MANGVAPVIVLALYRDRKNYALSLRQQIAQHRRELWTCPPPDRANWLMAAITKLLSQLADVGRVSA